MLPAPETRRHPGLARARTTPRDRGAVGGARLAIRARRGPSAGRHRRRPAADLLRLEGFPTPSLRARRARPALAAWRGPRRRDAASAAPLGRHPRRAFFAGREMPVWRISTRPTDGPSRRGIRRGLPALVYDWGGGLVWVAGPAEPMPAPPSSAPRSPLAATRRWSARLTVRRRVAMFDPPPEPRSAQTACRFNPRIFQPGRLPTVRLVAYLPASRSLAASHGVNDSATSRIRTGPDAARHDQFHPRPARLRSAPAGLGEDPAAPACIAASAPRPARPICCSATSSIARAGASISSRTCWRTTSRPTSEVVSISTAASPASSCMTTCPSGVHYMHLVDHARAHIEETYERPLHDRLMRAAAGRDPALSRALPARACWRRCWRKPVRRLVGVLPAVGARLAAMLGVAPTPLPPARSWTGRSASRPKGAAPRARGAAPGCAQPVLDPGINEATIRLLDRHGVEVVLPKGEGCCGALSITWAASKKRSPSPRATSTPGRREIEGEGLDAILDHRLGLRHDDQGLRLHVPRRAGLCGEGGARLGAGARTSPNSWPTLDLAAAAVPGLTSPITPPARCSMASRSRTAPKRAAGRAPASGQGRARGPYLLRLGRHLQHPAARDRRRSCATARSAISSGPAGCHRHRQYRLHHADRGADAPIPSSTPSNCSTGRPAARCPRSWRGRGSRIARSPGRVPPNDRLFAAE